MADRNIFHGDVDMLNFSHQRGFFAPENARPVTLIGAGSVGSHVAAFLVRMGITKLTVYDSDNVDSHNIGPSLYGLTDFGKYKVDALSAIILRDTGVAISAHRSMYAGESLRSTVICCVDTMEARKVIWEKVRKNLFVDLYIDTRTAEEFYTIFAIQPCKQEDIDFYEHFLTYSSEEATPQMCGGHSAIYMSSRVACDAVPNLLDFWVCGRKTRYLQYLRESNVP